LFNTSAEFVVEYLMAKEGKKREERIREEEGKKARWQ